MKLFIDGYYRPRNSCDSPGVHIKALTEQTVVAAYVNNPSEFSATRDEFERLYYLVPIFENLRDTLWGRFEKDGTRVARDFTGAAIGESTGDWAIDLARVPAEAYVHGWQPT